MERLNPAEVSIAYDEIRAKFRKSFPDEKTLSKTVLADYLGIKPSMLYNPSSYRDLLFLTRLVGAIKSANIHFLRDFVCGYKKGSYDRAKRFNLFFGDGKNTKTSDSSS